MAALTGPVQVAARHPSAVHVVDEGRWSDDMGLAEVLETVLPNNELHGAIETWIIDDTGMPKQGRHFEEATAARRMGSLNIQNHIVTVITQRPG